MAIQYYMRGYNTAAPGTVGYVDWVVNDSPDSTATYVPSPYVSGNIINIIVNRIITSKVDNFLKPFQSLAALGNPGSDGYFYHLNSYDWLHHTPPGPPIPVPSYLVGLSVVRGSADGVTPRDYATLFWNESTGSWKFAYNTSGDGTTVGAALPVSMGTLNIDGYLSIGTNPAQSGVLRIPNNQEIRARNVGNTADIDIIGSDNLNRVVVGSASTRVYMPGDLRVDGYIRDGGTSTLSGFIRNSNNTSIISFRNSGNTQDITALSSTSGNLITLGDAVNLGLRFNTATGFEHIFEVNSVNLARIGNADGTTYFNFESTALFPGISQFDTSTGNGQNLKFKAQSTSSVSGIGGSAIVDAGHGLSSDGYVDLRINNVPKIRVFGSTVPTTPDFPNNAGSNPNSIQIINPTIRWYNTVSSPSIIQDLISAANGQTMLMLAQTTTGVGFKGGDLDLSSGASNANAKDGYVRLQTGQINRLLLDPTANRATLTLSGFSFNGLDGTFDAAAVINPIIRQRDDVTNGVTGQLMTVRAQNTTGLITIGGSLNMGSGSGTSADGYVRLLTGNNTRLFLDATNNQATLTLNTFSFNGLDGSADQVNVVNPIIRQRDWLVSSVTGNRLTVQSQNAPNNGIGGNLFLTTGIGGATASASVSGPAYTRNGRLFLQTAALTGVGEFFTDGYGPYLSIGGTTSAPATNDGYFRTPNNVRSLTAAANPAFAPYAPNRQSIHLIGTNDRNQILIGDADGYDTVVIPGNLLVGTFQHVNETFLEVEDRLIYINWNQAAIGVTVNPPTQIAGITVHRGNDAAELSHDEAGFVWVEGLNLNASDGYWKAGSILNGNGSTLQTSLHMMGRALVVTDHPTSIIAQNINPTAGLVPGVGGLRTLNGSTAVSARNAASTQDLLLLGTDGYDRILHGSTVNLGQVFNTNSTGTHDFQINSVSVATIDTNKFSFNKGRRRHVTNVSGTYVVLVTDDYLAVNASSVFTITLPTSPTVGDTYEFKDINGTCNTNNITISGSANIDGASSLVMNVNYMSLTLTYTGVNWSIS